MEGDYGLFARVVRAGSLSGAARESKLSVASVSKRLSRLERRLGARLLHRTTRKVALTQVGQAFYEDVAVVLAAIETAEARVAGRAERASGRLRVSAPTSFGRMHVAPHLTGFLESYPDVELELVLDDAYVDLIDGQIDLAIRITVRPEAAVSAERLAANVRVLCAAPSYIAAQGAPETLRDLRKHKLLTASHQTPWRLEGPGGAQVVPVTSRVKTNSSEVVRELAIAGAGVALRSTWDVVEDLQAGRLVRVMPKWSGASDVGIYAVRPRGGPTPASVSAFISYLKGLYGARPYWDSPAKTKRSR